MQGVDAVANSFYNKTQEFRTWLLEERKLNPEGLSKDQERKEFAVFVEDYNTGNTMLYRRGWVNSDHGCHDSDVAP